MRIKIGEKTLLAGNTVLESGEQVNVSRATAGDTKAPLSMAVTSEESSPAYDPDWLNDDNGIVNVAMVKRLIELLAGGLTEDQINAIVNLHNSSTTAHTAELSKKMDKPTGGTTGQVLTKTAAGEAWLNMAGGSEFDDYFTLGNSNSSWILLEPKSKGADLTISNESGELNLMSGRRIYINSYADLVFFGTSSVAIGSGSREVFYSDSNNTTIKAEATITLVDANGSAMLGDLIRIGDVYFHESTDSQGGQNLSKWADGILPAGWYKVEVMLFSKTDVTISMLIANSTGMEGRIKSVQSIMYGGSNVNSGVPYCYYYTSSPWNGGSGSRTCRIAQLNFLYKHLPSNGIDWMYIDDLIKFYGGSVRYTPVSIPDEL